MKGNKILANLNLIMRRVAWAQIVEENLNKGIPLLCKVEHYIGNREYRKSKYKYLILTPYYNSDGFFRTDAFSSKEGLENAKLKIFDGNSPRLTEEPKPYYINIGADTFSGYYKKQGILHFTIPELIISKGEPIK